MSYTDERTSNRWRVVDLSKVATFEEAEDGKVYPSNTIYMPFIDVSNQEKNEAKLSLYHISPGVGHVVIIPKEREDTVYLHAILEDKWDEFCSVWIRDWRVEGGELDTMAKLYTVKIPYHTNRRTRKRTTDQIEGAKSIERKALSMLETADTVKRNVLLNMFRK